MAHRTVHFILHVPRCAGTTVERHFERHLGSAFRYPPRWNSPLRHIVGNRYPGLTAAETADVRVVSGHSLSTGFRACFPEAEIRESVLLRDPLSHLVSLYNLRQRRFREGTGREPPDFSDWYARQRRNPISRFLLNRYFEQGIPALYALSSAARLDFLEARLARFHFVGAHRRVGELLAGISAELGIPGKAERFGRTDIETVRGEDLPDALVRRIERENELDNLLYQRWAERGWSGAPAAVAPATTLPRLDHLSYLVTDIRSGLAKI